MLTVLIAFRIIPNERTNLFQNEQYNFFLFFCPNPVISREIIARMRPIVGDG